MAKVVQHRLHVEEFEREYMGKRAELWRGKMREILLTENDIPRGEPVLSGFELPMRVVFE